MERIPVLHYSILTETALRKKLVELGIPNHGSRALLQRRHTEWVNLVNANCDSRNPRSKRDLLADLDTWDRTQGRQIANNPTNSASITSKDFDGKGWATQHKDDFASLIANARKARIKEPDKLEPASGPSDMNQNQHQHPSNCMDGNEAPTAMIAERTRIDLSND